MQLSLLSGINNRNTFKNSVKFNNQHNKNNQASPSPNKRKNPMKIMPWEDDTLNDFEIKDKKNNLKKTKSFLEKDFYEIGIKLRNDK